MSDYKVFSCFSCGGGSTMGYKMAGYDVIGNCEIDPKINAMYVKNHKPKYNYCMDIRQLTKQELPEELYSLDILDGSPPCSVFSMAGDREKSWNKKKVFREGQKAQRLDDLFAYFIEVARVLQPKIVIAENVRGIISGNAKGYVNEILKLFDIAGYSVQIFLLNAAFMEVPQKRERVFFIAGRNDLNLPKLKMGFNYKLIPFGEVRSKHGKPLPYSVKYKELLRHRQKGDNSIADISERVLGKRSGMNNIIASDDEVAATLVASGRYYRMSDGLSLSDEDMIAMSTFPAGYDFNGMDVKYVCGMSVPPKMMYHISTQVKEQWLDKKAELISG